MRLEAPRSEQPRSRMGSSRKLQHALVPAAMLVSAIAIGIAGNLHLGLSPEISIAVSACLFCLMLMSHMLLSIADETDAAEEDTAARMSEQVASPMPMEPVAREIHAERSQADRPLHEMSQDARDAALREADSFDARGLPDTFTQSPTRSLDVPPQSAAAEPTPKAAAASVTDWNFRPTNLQLPAREAPAAVEEFATADAAAELPGLGTLRPADHDAFGQLPASAASLQADASLGSANEAERIDAILKRLAQQIHTGSSERRRSAAAGSDGADVGNPTLAMPPETGGAALEQLAAEQHDNALSSAVDALRSTVKAMRGPVAPAEAPPSSVELRIAAVAEAIQAERAEVFLTPILGLSDQQAHHFEVSVKLRAEGDEGFDTRAVAAGAGLLPLLDALNVRHAAGFALMLERRARAGSVFSKIGGTSLEDERFVSDLTSRHAQGVAGRMVLTFLQEDVRALGPAQIEALGDLGRLGFRFALEGVADLDMDFEALKAIGFDFVKLDTSVFQAGLICGGESVPPADICLHLEEVGLTGIATGIADPATRDLMVGCGVVFGQGALFGPPRPVPVVSPAGGSMAA
jgi:EAL domain-containing protein (putative c-di-GMP-specific phosphodiesterase class I)